MAKFNFLWFNSIIFLGNLQYFPLDMITFFLKKTINYFNRWLQMKGGYYEI